MDKLCPIHRAGYQYSVCTYLIFVISFTPAGFLNPNVCAYTGKILAQSGGKKYRRVCTVSAFFVWSEVYLSKLSEFRVQGLVFIFVKYWQHMCYYVIKLCVLTSSFVFVKQTQNTCELLNFTVVFVRLTSGYEFFHNTSRSRAH